VFERWDDLIGDREHLWHFVRVEPLAAEQQELLLNQDGQERYRKVPDGGRNLLQNPRTIKYIRKCEIRPEGEPAAEPTSLRDYALQDLRTASHVFGGAVQHMIIEGGMAARAARTLKLPPGTKPPRDLIPGQIEFAHDLLAALAYTMYCGDAADGGDGPNVSHVPPGKMEQFLEDVCRKIRIAGIRHPYTLDALHHDVKALNALNSKIHYDLLDGRFRPRSEFRWYDRSLQEFYAAWWLSRHATDDDIRRLRQWRYSDLWQDRAKKSLYEPLWGFLVEMPVAVRKDEVWLESVKMLFEPGVERCCEMIYRAWPALDETAGGPALIESWRQEFRVLLDEAGKRGDAARSIPAGFRRCPKNSRDDGKPFDMGSPPTEDGHRDDETKRSVVVAPFAMHQYPVTNAQYELFDPGHADERWGYPPETEPHPVEAGDHPVVNVTWYQAWCFARWTNNRLPTEAEWEYACRGGARLYQTFHFGDSLSSRQANFNGNYPYGGAKKGKYLERTTKVGSYRKNTYGLYDMHGNVWEWCESWHDAEASARVLRGGGWYGSGRDCRSAYRSGYTPDDRILLSGFRLAAVPAVGAEQDRGKRRPRSRPE
jgi:hypothetical protein